MCCLRIIFNFAIFEPYKSFQNNLSCCCSSLIKSMRWDFEKLIFRESSFYLWKLNSSCESFGSVYCLFIIKIAIAIVIWFIISCLIYDSKGFKIRLEVWFLFLFFYFLEEVVVIIRGKTKFVLLIWLPKKFSILRSCNIISRIALFKIAISMSICKIKWFFCEHGGSGLHINYIKITDTIGQHRQNCQNSYSKNNDHN